MGHDNELVLRAMFISPPIMLVLLGLAVILKKNRMPSGWQPRWITWLLLWSAVSVIWSDYLSFDSPNSTAFQLLFICSALSFVIVVAGWIVVIFRWKWGRPIRFDRGE